MRNRSTTLFSYNSSSISYNRATCGATYNPTTFNRANLGIKSISDCVTPHYHSILTKGGVLPYLPVIIKTDTTEVKSPMTFTTDRKIAPICNLTYGSQILSDSSFTIPALPSIDGSAITQVVNASIASAKTETFDALTAAAELHKTADMIANRVNRVFRIANRAALRASRERGVRRQLAVFNSLWLELRYGWRPLVYDVSNACRQLSEKPRLRNEGHSSVSVDFAASTTKTNVGTATQHVCTCVRSGTRTYRGFALASGHFGSAPGFQPFRSAWELVPFSFVVDWFFDVGSFISAVTPIPGVDTLASGYSIHDEWTLEQRSHAEVVPAQAANYTVITTQEGLISTSANYYSRFPSGVSIPSLYPRLNTLKIVDIGSLVFQRALPLRLFIPKRL